LGQSVVRLVKRKKSSFGCRVSGPGEKGSRV
jgi:hypothetical protein